MTAFDPKRTLLLPMDWEVVGGFHRHAAVLFRQWIIFGIKKRIPQAVLLCGMSAGEPAALTVAYRGGLWIFC